MLSKVKMANGTEFQGYKDTKGEIKTSTII